MNEMNVEDFIKRCDEDVPFFAKHILYKGTNKELSFRQIELIDAMRTQPHTAAIFNRQGGKTEALAVYDIHELCFGKTKDGGTDNTFIYAPILSQTEIIMGRLHQFMNAVPLLNNFVKSRRKYFIEMINGNKIQAVSASEQSHVRGFSPTKIQIDESQDISDRMYFDDILPSGAATGAKIQETGTPKGRNHFYQISRMTGKDIKVVYQTWEECPFIDKAYVMRRKARMPTDKFNAEFCCKFLVDSNVAFSTKILDKVIILEDTDELPTFTHYYLGGDIGKQDESVFTIFGLYQGKLYMVEMKRLSAFKSYKTVIETIIDLYDEYNISYGLIDMTGVGEGIVDMLPDNLKVDGIFQSSEAKQEMIDEFLKLAEGDTNTEDIEPKIFLWKDYDLRQQFYEYEAQKLRSGKIRYHHPSGKHDDIVMSILCGVKAFIDDSIISNYGGTQQQSGNSKRGSFGALQENRNPSNVLRGNNPYK
jgi:hypothetical protein